MSKPLAAKGIGACLGMFSTPGLDRLCLSIGGAPEHVQENYNAGRAHSRCTRVEGRNVMRLIVNALRTIGDTRIAEQDPLPPNDRLVVGSTLALEDLYRSQSARLQRYFTANQARQDAADLVQESFARLAEAGRDPARRIEEPEAYLSRVATNLLRNRARSALQRSLGQQVPAEEAGLRAPDMIAALEARDMLARLQAALEKLKPKTREIFLALRVDGMSYRDIAAAQGLSMKGVEWHMRKAIAQLDRALRAR